MKGDMHMMWKWTKTIPTHNYEIPHDDADKSTLLICRRLNVTIGWALAQNN